MYGSIVCLYVLTNEQQTHGYMVCISTWGALEYLSVVLCCFCGQEVSSYFKNGNQTKPQVENCLLMMANTILNRIGKKDKEQNLHLHIHEHAKRSDETNCRTVEVLSRKNRNLYVVL